VVQLLIERAWAKLHATFPERQIYIRSEGRIQFFTFSSSFQATCAGLCLIFLGWVTFSSVNVVFKDRIIAARDHHFHQMQGAYESRVADLQLSYDELNGALVSAENRFKSTVDELAAKQRSIAGLVRGKPAVGTLTLLPGSGSKDLGWFGGRKPSSPNNGIGAANDSLGADATRSLRSPGYSPTVSRSVASHGSGSSELGIMPQPVDPQPRTARPVQASMFGGALLRLFGAFLPSSISFSPIRAVDSREFSSLAQQTRRASRLSRSETALVIAFDAQLLRQIGLVNAALAHAGLDSAKVLRGGAESGAGGPLVSLRDVRMEGISDSAFVSAYTEAAARESQLAALKSALSHVPLAMPVSAHQFAFSSGFGPRVDPFSGRVAFHTGVDLAGPWGASVYATAAGVVDWAGIRGGYGNMVEIDHGYGFRTRYGHLSAISVRPGETVEAGTIVGKIGSTGRSTGPHLHYEVWLANSVKDPDKYLEMGHRLFE
jgi:murein DD-endopeptidase MepM/ murein hydrolase activator NlpD